MSQMRPWAEKSLLSITREHITEFSLCCFGKRGFHFSHLVWLLGFLVCSALWLGIRFMDPLFVNFDLTLQLFQGYIPLGMVDM